MTSGWFRRFARPWPLALLLVLQVLAPLLHAHFGEAKAVGVHVHAVKILGLTDAAATPDGSGESADVEVQFGAPALADLALDLPPMFWSLITLLVMGTLIASLQVPRRPGRPRRRRRTRAANAPPPALAPPTCA